MKMSSAFIVTAHLLACWAIGESRIREGGSSNAFSGGNEPLILTPYLERGDLDSARSLSRCGELPSAPPLESYSGLFTVNKEYNSNLFFWFFPATNKNVSAPVLLWLQGGPGISGLFGLFVEHGPYVVRADMTATLREYHWAKTFHLLYVDNPVGAGYSFTDDERGYVTNQDEMADDMFEFLQQFFTLFHEYRDNDFYVAGESYAGKYVPSLAHKIHSMGSVAKMRLRGMSIGNGMCDPETMMDYSDYLYNIGLVDEIQAAAMRNLSDSIVRDIREERFMDALVAMDKLIIHLDVLPYISLYKNFTGFDFYYNFLISRTPDDFEYFSSYIKHPQFRAALHLGDLPFQDGKKAKMQLLQDIMKSAKPNVTAVMNNYKVLIYNGQLDVIIPYVLTVNFIKTIQWKHSEDYKRTQRKIWYLNDGKEIAGYVRSVGDFNEILIRNAGHILPYDQPEVAFDLISRFIYNIPYA